MTRNMQGSMRALHTAAWLWPFFLLRRDEGQCWVTWVGLEEVESRASRKLGLQRPTSPHQTLLRVGDLHREAPRGTGRARPTLRFTLGGPAPLSKDPCSCEGAWAHSSTIPLPERMTNDHGPLPRWGRKCGFLGVPEPQDAKGAEWSWGCPVSLWSLQSGETCV